MQEFAGVPLGIITPGEAVHPGDGGRDLTATVLPHLESPWSIAIYIIRRDDNVEVCAMGTSPAGAELLPASKADDHRGLFTLLAGHCAIGGLSALRSPRRKQATHKISRDVGVR
jgi:hypothetical protein